jgi:TetR/AcrR family transcriptional regulator of autoinduction and epiphytic fitness
MSTSLSDPQLTARRPGRPVSMEKRKAILKAARAEFSTLGYRDASMDAIAKKAGVSKRTLYNHFAGKERLFRELVTGFVRDLGERVRLDYDPRSPLHGQLEDYARRSIEFLKPPGNLRFFRMVFAEHIRNPARVEHGLSAYWKGEYGLTAWVEAACHDGRLAPRDAARASRIFAGLIRGLFIWPALLGRKSFESPELTAETAEAIEMFLAYFTAKQARTQRAGA